MAKLIPIEPIKTGTLIRSAQLHRARLDKENRTITVRFSTETPVSRWFGTEILSHEAGCVKLDRFNAGAAVLMEHDIMQRCGTGLCSAFGPLGVAWIHVAVVMGVYEGSLVN